MEGLSIGDLLVIQEVQRKDYGRSPGLSRALASMGITDIYTHLTQKSEVQNSVIFPVCSSFLVYKFNIGYLCHEYMCE